jgi:hypothetical protein
MVTSIYYCEILYDYDDETMQYMRQQETAWTTEKDAVLHVMDTVYALTDCTPEQAEVLANSRDNGRTCVELVADGIMISYTIASLNLQTRKKENN